VLGALLIGWFGTHTAGGTSADGVFYGGGFHLLKEQAIAVVAVVAYAFVASLIIAKVIDLIMGMRVKAEDEDEGMDTTMHGESAYEFNSGLSSGAPRGQMTSSTGPRHEVNA
jgi:Amt family ammonium transporter